MNAPAAPAKRGQVLTIYCTGLGVVAPSDSNPAVQNPVTVLLNNIELQPAFAGLSGSGVGLYQVDVMVPAAMPPGLDLPLLLRQTGGDSNTVFIAVQ